MGMRVLTNGSIELTDDKGVVRMRMGVFDEEPIMARARLYVHGQPRVCEEVTSQNNWEQALALRNAWGPGHVIYLWQDTKDPQTEWRCMGEYGWKYAVPPKEIALANYLMEGV